MGCNAMGCDGMGCDGMGWDAMGWDAMRWDGMRWDAMRWDGMRWDAMGCDGMRCDGMGWHGLAISACTTASLSCSDLASKGGPDGPLSSLGVDSGGRSRESWCWTPSKASAAAAALPASSSVAAVSSSVSDGMPASRRLLCRLLRAALDAATAKGEQVTTRPCFPTACEREVSSRAISRKSCTRTSSNTHLCTRASRHSSRPRTLAIAAISACMPCTPCACRPQIRARWRARDGEARRRSRSLHRCVHSTARLLWLGQRSCGACARSAAAPAVLAGFRRGPGAGPLRNRVG